MNNLSRLSVPQYYQYQPEAYDPPQMPEYNITYVISPDCKCISDEKFDEEILDPITTNTSAKSKRNTRKSGTSTSNTSKKNNKKPTIKIY